MIDVKKLRENPELFREAIQNKNEKADIEAILELDARRRELLQDGNGLKHRRNVVSEEIGQKKKAGEDVSDQIAAMQKVAAEIKEIDVELAEVEEELDTLLLTVPNVPHESAPVGPDESANVEVRTWGEAPEFDFEPLNHTELGDKLGLFDLERGAQISGSGFPLYTGPGAKLERALLSFMIDFHVENHGYTEVMPPLLATRDSMQNTGQLPKLEEDMYHISSDDLFLIPTAEVPVTNIHKGEILKQDRLPTKYVAFTPCFRREAGSYGRDTRGFLRLHQFNKVEMVQLVKPEESYQVLESLTNNAEAILQALELPYRVLSLATGDLSFAAAKCYDLEIWAPGENRWLEVSSCSNFEDFQARRGNIRYRNESTGQTEFVHTLNGSGVATARLLVALLETHQTDEGTVKLPEVLQPYLGTTILK
ncbi:MAG: serine--tRNA ligase [Candidatus Marinimicrobia bacterium]|nr:serine--tRNA ligase [Candidatus Neomarinimicrobiota bacterium]MCF7830360.1 serine--tRNA ligase [Candidatus Neomarinimicrobiota bacterium]MCF7882456.1 serine--tRNA ligase [Candidatus Neomarinimicrobiota bacterium]